MTPAPRRSTDGVAQRGLVRGCCLGVLLLLALLGLLAFAVDRAMAAPDLGSPPGGTSHGDTQQAIAVSLAVQIAAELIVQDHAVVTLSERDLTVLAAQNNQNPGRFHNLQARVRNGQVVVSADTSFGPLGVTMVTYLTVSLDRSAAPPVIDVRSNAVDIGALHVPGWLKDRFAGSSAPTISLDQLFSGIAAAKPVLSELEKNVECLSVAPDGVRIGVHRPGAGADTTVCGGS